MKSVLVTGGAGFLGSHLCDRLLAAKRDHVTVFDDCSTGRRRNLAQHAGSSLLELCWADVRDPLFGRFDQIYHLACPASPVQYQKEPVRTAEVAALGTLSALRCATDGGSRLLHASTSEIYGDPEVHPQPESYHGNVATIGPRACYDEGKRLAETFCGDFAAHHELDVRVARIFNTYGPRMARDDGRVVSEFVCAALQGRPLRIDGDGSQSRSFCFVDDLVEALVRLMASPSPPLICNLGNPEEVTILELAELCLELVDRPGEIDCAGDGPPPGPVRRCPDITIAEEALDGWLPQVSLREGLQRTMAWFDDELSRPDEA